MKPSKLRPYLFAAFAIIVMMSCWDSNRTNAAVVEGQGGIPEDAIRLRILAHSDAPRDQLIKRIVRDEVIQQIQEWMPAAQGLEAARYELNKHLPEIEQLVGRVLAANGFSYSYQAELDRVTFPAKMFENRPYPAGEYEALRITIGSGQGQNWWCVLFPPLCFVDGVKVPKAKATMNFQTKSKIGQMGGISEAEIMEKMLKGGMSEAEIMKKMLKGGMSEAEIMEKLKNGGIGEFKAMSSSLEMNNAGDWEELEVRFFFLDMFYSAQAKIKGWF